MRKWIVIALSAVFAIIGLAVFLKPGEPCMEDHIEGYRAAVRGLPSRPTLRQKVRGVWNAIWGKEATFDHLAFVTHQEALIRLGYLEERTFVVSNRPVSYVSSNVFQHVVSTQETNMLDFTPNFTHDGTNTIRILTRSEDIPKWEALIRKADVPGPDE